ncbi:tetratricopeptide repeat protein [Acidovorax sp. Be4]|uniref:Tetratricopeptide repeat protein n=1 Tax=Acidovorax bellezanensis TaxID=2976702 RepID=A0ABT2PPX9_9BURK|nr:tetratricopeptide repeat protein [Acidovorax sp. Be4]MCT9812298.1 tetratricopeptide repeat protein [Acidovorax sp. Be4]
MLAVLAAWGIALCSLSAHASRSVDEVAQLLDQGNAKQAAKQAETYLKQNPGDVEMRFMQGVIATEQKQSAQAIKIFSTLIRDYPNMPEPYNNLAVLYAADGQERKAAEALEQAIRTNPSYTTAHENLGDLYARMASEAYSKALQLDGSRKAIPPKLALITQLVPGQQTPAKTLVAAASTSAAAAPSAPRATQAEAKVEPKQEAKTEKKPEVLAVASAQTAPKVEAKAPVKSTPAVVAPVAAAAPVVAAAVKAEAPKVEVKPAKPSAAEAAPAPAEKPAVAAKPAAQVAAAEVESAVNAWAAAWQKQDMARYLNAYSEKFVPADGTSLDKWKEARRVRIVGKDNITVALQNVRVSVDGDQATAKFRQRYVAGSLNSTTRKTLALRHEKGSWRIVRESTGG